MTDLPFVSIVLVNWNGKDDTLACLGSLAAADYRAFDVTVVDNASEDGSVDAIREKYPHVHVIANDTNERFARANNQGIERALAAGADYVLLLNNDTEVAPDFLQIMLATAKADVSIGMVGPKIYFFNEPEKLWYAGGIVDLWRGRIAHVGIHQLDRGQYDDATDTGYITACAVLVTRACLERIGGLDDTYFMYGEDVDWCQRARLAGFRVIYEPRARVWHKVSSSSGGKQVAGGLTPFKIRHKTRSMFRFFREYASWYQWLTIPLFMAGQAVAASFMMLRAGNWGGLGALFTALGRKKN